MNMKIFGEGFAENAADAVLSELKKFTKNWAEEPDGLMILPLFLAADVTEAIMNIVQGKMGHSDAISFKVGLNHALQPGMKQYCDKLESIGRRAVRANIDAIFDYVDSTRDELVREFMSIA